MTANPEAEHSLLSASAAPRWTRCYGSVALESTQPNEGSSFANEGTAAHGLAAYLLSGEPNKEITEAFLERRNPIIMLASEFIGETINAKGQDIFVDVEFAGHVQTYVDYVLGLGGVQLIETRVNYADWLGVPEHLAWGTSDAIVIHDDPEFITIDVNGYLVEIAPGDHDPRDNDLQTGRLIMSAIDLKFGKGVAVSPRNNEQAKLYTGGALNEIGFVIDVRDDDIVRIVIHQPRIGEGAPLEWYITVGALKRWLKVEAAMAAQHAVKLYDVAQSQLADNITIDDVGYYLKNELKPGDKQCRFCNAKAICPALTQHVVDTVANQFVDLDALETTLPKTLSAKADVNALTPVELADKMRSADLIEAWVKAVRAKVEGTLFAGDTVPGYKLVRGKQGDRKWSDEEAAAKYLQRKFGAAEAFQKKVITPPAAEKLVKRAVATKGDQEKVMASLGKFITRAEGGISVAPESDPREAYDPTPTADAFTNLEGEADDLSYLA